MSLSISPRTALRSPLVALAITAALTSGCITTHLKRAPGIPEQKPQPVLVGGISAQFISTTTSDQTVLNATIDAMQNASLVDFGAEATKLLEAKLSNEGYAANYDEGRVRDLDLIKLGSNASTAALLGHWHHAQTSSMTPDRAEGLFSNPKDVVGKIKRDGKEYFAFCGVDIWDVGVFFKEPMVKVRVVVYDETGKPVLDMQGMGAGASQFFIADRTPTNLMKALNAAFASLEKAPVQSL